MAGKKNHSLHTIQAEVEEIDEKIKKHRSRIRNRILTVVIVAVVVMVAFYVYFRYKTYEDYQVVSSVEHKVSAAAQFEKFNGYLLEYGNDGASCTDFSNRLIWNQTYEMQEPQIDICGIYLVIYDKQGNQIFIMDTTGLQGSMETTKPIKEVHVAQQGTIAVLTSEGTSSYIQLYDKTGTALAKGEIHINNSGYPLDIALSDDAQKMAVAMLDVTDGKVKTTIGFYNFGSVGQSEVDNIVSSYSYSGTLIPRIEFVTNDRMLAFGDNLLLVFEGTQKPEETAQVIVRDEIKSIYYNADYLGIVLENSEIGKEAEGIKTEETELTEQEGISDTQAAEREERENGAYQLKVYDTNGKQVLSRNFDLDYKKVEFLENGEICITNEKECEIFTMGGTKKFHAALEGELRKVFSKTGIRQYTFVFAGEIQEVMLN